MTAFHQPRWNRVCPREATAGRKPGYTAHTFRGVPWNSGSPSFHPDAAGPL